MIACALRLANLNRTLVPKDFMIRLIAAILTLLLLQGCSAIKLGYQQLPTLSYWWLDSAISFNDAQSDQAKEALNHVHQWHRSQELATYQEVLLRIAELSQGPIQPSQVCSAWTDIQHKLDQSMRVAITQAVPVVQMLGPRQLSHLAKHQESKSGDDTTAFAANKICCSPCDGWRNPTHHQNKRKPPCTVFGSAGSCPPTKRVAQWCSK